MSGPKVSSYELEQQRRRRLEEEARRRQRELEEEMRRNRKPSAGKESALKQKFARKINL